MTIKVTTYAKVGELLQGSFGHNYPFLVSNISSKLLKTNTVISTKPNQQGIKLGSKVEKAIDLFHSVFEKEKDTSIIGPIYLNQQRNFQIGKGLSSSSTDILGVFMALNKLHKTKYSNEYLYKLAAKIEPTDPCLNSNSLLFNQKTGEVLETIPAIPLSMLYFDSDPEIKINTIRISSKRQYSESQIVAFQNLYSNFKKGAENKDYHLFFECVTMSAIINETILPKKSFTLLLDFATENNCGVFVAHSGTFMGLIIEPNRLPLIELKAKNFVAKHWNTPLYIE